MILTKRTAAPEPNQKNRLQALVRMCEYMRAELERMERLDSLMFVELCQTALEQELDLQD